MNTDKNNANAEHKAEVETFAIAKAAHLTPVEVLRYIDGSLSDGAYARIEAHLAHCEKCAARVMWHSHDSCFSMSSTRRIPLSEIIGANQLCGRMETLDALGREIRQNLPRRNAVFRTKSQPPKPMLLAAVMHQADGFGKILAQMNRILRQLALRDLECDVWHDGKYRNTRIRVRIAHGGELQLLFGTNSAHAGKRFHIWLPNRSRPIQTTLIRGFLGDNSEALAGVVLRKSPKPLDLSQVRVQNC